jgi:hypothetical protein
VLPALGPNESRAFVSTMHVHQRAHAHAHGPALPSGRDRPPPNDEDTVTGLIGWQQGALEQHPDDDDKGQEHSAVQDGISGSVSLVDWLQEEADGSGRQSAPPSSGEDQVPGQSQAQGHLSRISDLVEYQGPVPSGVEVESVSVTPDEKAESMEGEDPRTWTRGIITGNLILRDERTGKSLVVPYNLAKIQARFRSGTFTTNHALEERGPDLSQSIHSPQNDSWRDESVNFVQEDISRGELRARGDLSEIALDLPSLIPRQARTSWSHGGFSSAGDAKKECERIGSVQSERQRQMDFEKKLASFKAALGRTEPEQRNICGLCSDEVGI